MQRTRTNVLFIGNPGVGKSTLFNALLGSPEFHAGVSLDGGGITKILQECTYNGVTYIDTPGLNDIECRKKCAQEITKALKRSGLYYICFIMTTEEGRLRPDDKVAVRLVLDAAPEIGGQYSIIVNKLPDPVFDHYKSHPDVFPSVFFRDFPASMVTNSIFYIKRDHNLEGDDRLFDPNVLAGFQVFLKQAPSITIHPEQVSEINPDRWSVMEKEYATTIDQLKKTMETNQSEFSKILREEKLRRQKAERLSRLKQQEIANQHRQETQNMQAQIMALNQRKGTTCCFPSSATVVLKGGATCPVSSVREGQFIQSVDDDGKIGFSEVYYVDGEVGTTTMCRLSYYDTDHQKVSFFATPEHLVYVTSEPCPIEDVVKKAPIPAKGVRVGQFVLIEQDGIITPHKVVEITIGPCEGRWSILTLSHRLFVDHLLVSSLEIDVEWATWDTWVMRKLYAIVPSFVVSPPNKWFCRQYDRIVEPILISLRDYFMSK